MVLVSNHTLTLLQLSISAEALKANDVTPNMDATVTSNGTMNLTVSNKIKGIYIDYPDAAKFIIDPAFIASNPYANTVNFNSGNNTLNIPIHFAANTEIRKFNAVLHIETDAPENPTCNLTAGTIETGTASLKTGNAKSKQFITLSSIDHDQTYITNDGSVDVTITDISAPKGAGSFVWKNLSKNNNTVSLPMLR